MKEFLSLSYNEQLRLINHFGKLERSYIIGNYYFTVYKVNDFYVELKRGIRELFFENLTAMTYEDLPDTYK